jgi:hypothetical protein
MDGPGGPVRRVRPVHVGRRVEVEFEQIAGLDGREVLPAAVKQEAAAILGDGRTEVIADGLAPPEPVAEAEGGGEVLPQESRVRDSVAGDHVHDLNRPVLTSAR